MAEAASTYHLFENKCEHHRFDLIVIVPEEGEKFKVTQCVRMRVRHSSLSPFGLGLAHRVHTYIRGTNIVMLDSVRRMPCDDDVIPAVKRCPRRE